MQDIKFRKRKFFGVMNIFIDARILLICLDFTNVTNHSEFLFFIDKFNYFNGEFNILIR